MKLSDITVEVRDKSLTRRGLIRPEDLDLTLNVIGNNVGNWTLQLAAEHPLVPVLKTPGSGIIVTGPVDVIASGPVNKPQSEQTPTDPAGKVTFEGITDDHIAADYLAWPKPTTDDVTAQTVSHDERTGSAEALMHAYVNANCGPAAPLSRRVAGLIMGANGDRGPTMTKKARFPVMGNLLTALGLLGNLGFRFVQRGSNIVFETFPITDRTATIRLDVRNNTLSGQRVAITPPAITRAIVAGQGQEEERKFIERHNTESLEGEADWGRRIEVFIDQRNTNDDDALAKAGDEQLLDKGFTAVSVQAVPMEDTLMELGRDWFVGDKVAVVVDDQELTSIVTGMVMKADSSGFKVGALLGDPTDFDWRLDLKRRLTTTEQRVSQMEREAGTVADLSTAFDALAADVATQATTIATVQTDLSTTQGDVSTLQGTTADLTDTTASTASDVSDLQAAASRLPVAMAAGSVVITTSAANSPTAATVTLPAGRFTTWPRITATPNTTVPGTGTSGVGVTGTSATAFTAWLTTPSPAARAINWHAVQMTETDRDG